MSTQLAFSTTRGTTAAPAIFGETPWSKETGNPRRTRESATIAGPAHHFGQDQQIYSEGDSAEVFFKVLTGLVRTCKFLGNGRRQIDAFYLPGDVFGLEAGQEHTFSAEAVCDCTVVAYRRHGLESLAERDEGLSHQMLSYAMGNLARAQEHALMLGRKSATEKLAAFLLEWAEHSAESEVVSLAMARQDIADYLGLTIETVSRTLSQLERDGVIELPTTRRIRLKNLAVLEDLNA